MVGREKYDSWLLMCQFFHCINVIYSTQPTRFQVAATPFTFCLRWHNGSGNVSRYAHGWHQTGFEGTCSRRLHGTAAAAFLLDTLKSFTVQCNCHWNQFLFQFKADSKLSDDSRLYDWKQQSARSALCLSNWHNESVERETCGEDSGDQNGSQQSGWQSVLHITL